MPDSRPGVSHRGFDLAGAVPVTSGLVVLVYAIIKAQAFGWGSARTSGLIAAGAILIAVFVGIEHRSAAPLMRLSIFRVRTLAVADSVLLLVASSMFGMFFVASLYVQDILGYSPSRAALFEFLQEIVGRSRSIGRCSRRSQTRFSRTRRFERRTPRS